MRNPINESQKTVNEEPVNQSEEEVGVEKQIIIHCRCDSSGSEDSYLRIWKTTYLIDHDSEYKCNLLFAFKISFYPVWDLLPGNSSRKFTLIFGGLPKSCRMFDLIEVADGTGEFVSKGIVRNKEDVYYLIFR